jgi:hypothetical protein
MTLTDQNRPTFPINPSEGLTPAGLRTLQIIAVAMILGIVVFLGIALYIVQVQNNGQGMNPRQKLPIISFVAVAMLAACAPMAFIIPAITTSSALRQILAGKGTSPPGVPASMNATTGARLFAVRQTSFIIGSALLEGPAFTGGIAYMLEANPLGLAVIAVAVLLMLYRFPTAERVRSWLERQAAVLTEMHQQAVQSGKW